MLLRDAQRLLIDLYGKVFGEWTTAEEDMRKLRRLNKKVKKILEQTFDDPF